MKRIIVINGSGSKGKDTFVEKCAEYVNVYNISSVDNVKKAAEVGADWDGAKDEKGRKLLADLKDLFTNYNNAPFRYITGEISYFIHPENKCDIMFIHIREPEEIQRVVDYCKDMNYSCSTLLVRSTRVADIKSNHADAEVENYKYDYIVDNDEDLLHLSRRAYVFLQALLKEDFK